MEDVQNELRRKYEIVLKPAVLWPNINFSLRTFTAYYISIARLAATKFSVLAKKSLVIYMREIALCMLKAAPAN